MLTIRQIKVSSTLASSLVLVSIPLSSFLIIIWLNSILVKYMRQDIGTNLCGYYVCEYIRLFTTERRTTVKNLDVCKQYSQIYFIIVFMTMILYIYTHTTHIHISLLLKDHVQEGRTTTTRAHTSNSRGIVGIFTYRGHRWKGRIACNFMISM